MNFKITHRTQLNLRKWDDLVQISATSRIYGLSAYLDAVYGEKWAVVTDSGFTFGMVIFPSVRWFLPSLTQPPFIQTSGLYGKKCTEEELRALLSLLNRKYWKIGFSLKGEIPEATPGFRTEKRLNLFLPLSTSYNLIKAGYSNNLKRILNKDSELLIAEEPPAREFISLAQKKFPPIQLGLLDNKQFERYVNRCHRAQLAEFITARNSSGELLAGLIAVKDENRLYLTFTVTGTRGRALNAMHFLIDRLIEKYSGANYTLDFEGSSISGVARFYRNFGTLEEYYHSFYKPLFSEKADRVLKGVFLGKN